MNRSRWTERLGIFKAGGPGRKGTGGPSYSRDSPCKCAVRGYYFISADYIGAARKRLEEAYGCPVMMVQGAAGDIRPRYHQDNMEYVEIHCWEMARKGFSQEYRQKYEPQSRRALEQMEEDVFRSVDAVYASLVLMPLERVEIRSSFCRFEADVPDMERAGEKLQRRRRGKAKLTGGCG